MDVQLPRYLMTFYLTSLYASTERAPQERLGYLGKLSNGDGLRDSG